MIGNKKTREQLSEEISNLRKRIVDLERSESKLVRVEEELKNSEKRYRELSNLLPQTIFEIDTEGNLTYSNQNGFETFGYQEEDFERGLNAFQMFIPEERTKLKNDIQRVLSEKNIVSIEYTALRKDGSTFPVVIFASPIIHNDKLEGVRGIIIDVTEQKKTEKDLLEREKQLKQVQKLEAIGRLTGGIAHDFNNILTVVIGFSDILLSHMEEQDLRHSYVKTIKEAGERASSLINQLLAFSRKQILKPRVININSIVSQMKKMLRHLIGEDIELTTNLEPDLDNAKLDSSQIEQVIMNLCINARDAMPHGGILTIETANIYLNEEYSRNHVSLEPGHYVMLVVIDNGIGMSQEIQERMFEPFFTTKEDSKGTGLGLSTVYGIIKQSNGSIWTYSEPGKGSTFKIYLPSVRKECDEEKDSRAFQPSLQGTETVLLVEDEGFVRDVASSILKSFGYRVLTAKCGEEAIEIVNKTENQSIDLMLTDVVMPGMSGTKLADKIKIKNPRIKIMFMSGYADEAIVHHGILDYEIPFIKKPFNMRDLGKQVREVLDTRDKTTFTAQI